MIEAKFTFFQMPQKGMLGNAGELVQAAFGKAPERLNAVDVGRTLHKLIMAMLDTIVSVEAHIHQAIVAAPAVGVDHRDGVDFAANDGLQRLFRAVRHNFRVHLAPAFEQGEDDGFPARAPAPLAAYPPRAEVAFVEFGRYRAPGLQAVTQAQVHIVDRTHAQARKPGGVGGRQIQGKQAQQVAKFGLGNSAAFIIAVSHLHNSKLCPVFHLLLPKPLNK